MDFVFWSACCVSLQGQPIIASELALSPKIELLVKSIDCTMSIYVTACKWCHGWKVSTLLQSLFLCCVSVLEGNNWCIPPNPRWVGIYRPIHEPLNGPLYMGSIYSNTPPQSELPAQRCSRLDKKRVQIEYKGQIPPAATTSHQLRWGWSETPRRSRRAVLWWRCQQTGR